MGADLRAIPTLQLLLFAATAAVLAMVVGSLIVSVLRRVARNARVGVLSGRLWQSPVVAVLVLLAISPFVAELDRRSAPGLLHTLSVLLIAALAWFGVVLIRTASKGALERHPDTGLGDEHSRHVRTNIVLMERIGTSVVIVLGVAAALWTYPDVRAVGVTLLASAGVLSIIAGLAAQTTLSNVFAGIQIAFSDGIRVGDVVVLEGRQGRIEEITLTFVAVEVWNETRLILPCTYFTTTPFENWTHSGNTAIGEVELVATYDAPIELVRAELARLLGASPLWDGRVDEIRVAGSDERGLLLLAQFSAASDAIEILKFQVREGLIGFLRSLPADPFPRERRQELPAAAWTPAPSPGPTPGASTSAKESTS